QSTAREGCPGTYPGSGWGPPPPHENAAQILRKMCAKLDGFCGVPWTTWTNLTTRFHPVSMRVRAQSLRIQRLAQIVLAWIPKPWVGCSSQPRRTSQNPRGTRILDHADQIRPSIVGSP